MEDRAARIAVMIMIAAAVVGCGESDDRADDHESPARPSQPSPGRTLELDEHGASLQIPADQVVYFDDDQIELHEYEDAYSRFARCATEAGEPVIQRDVDAVTGQIEFETAVPIVAAGMRLYDGEGQPMEIEMNASTACYQQYFDQVKIWFDLQDPTVQAAMHDRAVGEFITHIAPCLEQNGVDIPSDLDVDSREFALLQERHAELLHEGLCDD